MMLNTWPIGLMFKQHPRDEAMLMKKTRVIPIFLSGGLLTLILLNLDFSIFEKL